MTPKETKTLHLTLKKKWFDMILSGEKKEEYREIKGYWMQRLMIDSEIYKPYDTIIFKNGYSSNTPEITIQLKSIKIDFGVPDWGASIGVEYFVLKLGKIISTKNIKQ